MRSTRTVFSLGAIVVHLFAQLTTASGDGDQAIQIQTIAKQLLSIIGRRSDSGIDLSAPIQSAVRDAGEATSNHDDAASPQLKALRWLLKDRENPEASTTEGRGLPTDADFEILQKYALAVFYFSTNGDGWKTCSQVANTPCEDDAPAQSSTGRFLSHNLPACFWSGLTCADQSRKGHVSWIDLSRNNLVGSIPDELSLLSDDLELLWLSGNDGLVGSIPEWIGNFSHLQNLSLFETSLGGNLPPSLYTLEKLTALRLYGSKFKGTIATEIGELKELAWLWIHGNEFSGSLPSEIGHLKNIAGLTVHRNRFEPQGGGGAANILPQEVCNMRTENKILENLWMDCDTNRSCQCCSRCFEPH